MSRSDAARRRLCEGDMTEKAVARAPAVAGARSATAFWSWARVGVRFSTAASFQARAAVSAEASSAPLVLVRHWSKRLRTSKSSWETRTGVFWVRFQRENSLDEDHALRMRFSRSI